MRALHTILYSTTAVIMALNLCACSQDNSDLQEYIKTTKTKHVGSVKPLPQFKPYQNFSYSAAELRDPFEQAFEADEKEKTNDIKLKTERPKEPLESYPLDTLRMVGILEQNKQTWGLVKDPTNVVHRVQTGNYLGLNDGQIITVTEKQLDIIEIIPDGIGGYIERNATLAIGSD